MAAIHWHRTSLQVLEYLLRHPDCTYGSEMMKDLGIFSGTLYPMIKRFEERGYIVSSVERMPPPFYGTPDRRIITLTAEGRKIAIEVLTDRGIISPGDI